MALSPTLILMIMIVFSFIVTSIFMFKPKGNQTVNIIFFWLAIALNVLITFINATSLPSGNVVQVVIAWAGLLFSAFGIIIRLLAGKTNTLANLLIMLASVYGVVGYFVFA